jgi:circadian clock protein KaiC
MRNMHSIGINLEPWVKRGLLQFHAARPTIYGLETHLATIIKLINRFKPDVVILDPINAFVLGDNQTEVKAMLLRLVDFLKMKRITAFFTSLTSSGENIEISDVYISSLIDTWLLLRDIEIGGERNRGLYVLKSRGMAHSNQIREFKLTNHGIELLDVYVGSEGVLKDEAEQALRQQEIARKQIGLERRREAMEAQMILLRSDYEAEEMEALRVIGIDKERNEGFRQGKSRMAKSRRSDVTAKTRVTNKTKTRTKRILP